MLVLTRKKEQRIQIGQNITVTIIRVQGRSVQIGIEAPGEVRVLRGEFAGAADPQAIGTALPDTSDDSAPGCTDPPEGGDKRSEPPRAADDEPDGVERSGKSRVHGVLNGRVAVRTCESPSPYPPRNSARCSSRIRFTSSTARG